MVKTPLHHRNPERMAWAVLLAAFFTCVALTAAAGFGSNWWLRNAAEDQTVQIAFSGTVLARPPNRNEYIALSDTVQVGSIISVDKNAQATLNFIAPDGETVLATVTLYGETRAQVTQADSPRFSQWNAAPHRIRLDVESGRARAIVTGADVQIEIFSAPQAHTVITQPGSNVAVDAKFTQSSITVREGEALVSAAGQESKTLTKDQRAEVVPDQPITGPLSAEHNLITNGDFSAPMANTWAVNLLPPKNPDELPGQVFVVTRDGRPAVQFTRRGTDWGQAEITQDINRDVRDFKALRLHLDVLINQQDVFNCGVFGTECPVMVKIKYLDDRGNEQEWLQGFYYLLNATVPTYCVTCPEPRNARHELIQVNQWKTFESDDLLEKFAAAGAPAVSIKSITIYASGHSFEGFVADVQLLGAE